MFTTKAFAIPHLKMIICGTGVGGFLGRWFIKINDEMVVKGVDNLNFHAPEKLRNLWASYKEETSFPEYLTTTVYHFGFSETDKTMHAYAYRSERDFVSEALGIGVGVKPECKLPEKHEFPTDIIKMMDEQRYIQAKKSENERVYIGGERIIHHITKEGIVIYSLGKFDDFETTENDIYKDYEKKVSSNSY